MNILLNGGGRRKEKDRDGKRATNTYTRTHTILTNSLTLFLWDTYNQESKHVCFEATKKGSNNFFIF